ncbi:hypothetical protein HanXRQr2_Chr13g0582841 [Helianthus annuus]|uniref:Uncharacterized protein n=1 Tax=Helianthus annuus TaxID=4232 RepID=A0A9K3EH05_HELAN|nr:hypothetical protein HanXRQr2_Chr13g0582841 [Helianthus annuus]KAJ0822952.1 hypothetical protein HanPSC8_Chr16g0738061 [Helianthus annuus]KAJ0848738.1 hypothetical protein HanPSC8_Chr13g0560981 [Helianthus annuus]
MEAFSHMWFEKGRRGNLWMFIKRSKQKKNLSRSLSIPSSFTAASI